MLHPCELYWVIFHHGYTYIESSMWMIVRRIYHHQSMICLCIYKLNIGGEIHEKGL